MLSFFACHKHVNERAVSSIEVVVIIIDDFRQHENLICRYLLTYQMEIEHRLANVFSQGVFHHRYLMEVERLILRPEITKNV